jgi:hypothetical protein
MKWFGRKVLTFYTDGRRSRGPPVKFAQNICHSYEKNAKTLSFLTRNMKRQRR